MVHAICACIFLDIPLKEFTGFLTRDQRRIHYKKLFSHGTMLAHRKIRDIQEKLRLLEKFRKQMDREEDLLLHGEQAIHAFSMFQKKQIIYSETLGVCVVDNIVSLAASKREKAVPYYVLKPVFEDKVSYIPVEHHRVVLRDMFTREEALKLKETEQYKNDKHLRQAVDYVLDKVAIK